MNRILLILTLIVSGCTDRDFCEMVKGGQAFYGKHDVTCNDHGFSRPMRRVGIVHDYIFTNANKTCKNNGGLHYIVTDTLILDSVDEYKPCNNKYKFRCQDQTLHSFNNEAKYCFITERQLGESL